MSQAAQCHEPGLLLVLIRLKSPSYLHDFNHWYNTEHGPARMQLDFIKSGYRYRSASDEPEIWAGMYDIARVSAVTEARYTNLRKHRSVQEQEVMTNKLNVLERKIYKHISTRGHSQGPAPTLLRVSFVIRKELVDEMHRWYEEEHIDDLSRIPGWRRSRRFEVVDGDLPPPGCVELLALHEFDGINGLGGPEHIKARSRPWRNKIINMVESRSNAEFSFYHEFRADDYKRPPSPAPAALTWPHRRLSELHSGLAALEQEGLKPTAAYAAAAHFALPAVS